MNDNALHCTYYIHDKVDVFSSLIEYLLQLIEDRLEVHFERTYQLDEAVIRFGNDTHSYPINEAIYSPLSQLKPCEARYYRRLYIYRNEKDEKPDYLASIFSFIHCLGESLPGNQRDKLGRQTYAGSLYSVYFDTYTDIVTPLMQEFVEKECGLSDVSLKKKKDVFLSHDVDFLNSGFRQEVKYFVRKPSISLFKALLRHLFANAGIWSDLVKIVELERAYGMKSIFFMLPVAGTHKGINNADYSTFQLNDAAEILIKKGAEVGLHCGTSEASYHDQRAQIKVPTTINRNHYLLYQLPEDWKRIEEGGIHTDMGLGWNDKEGLRNGYPLAFKPYGSEIEVVPMVLMDTVFDKAGKPEELSIVFNKMISTWHSGYQVSILFHNNYLTPWSNAPFLKAYREILSLIVAGKKESESIR